TGLGTGLLAEAAGLSEAEAAARLQRDGPNALRPPRGTPGLVRFGRQLAGGLQCLMWVAAAICLIAYGVQRGQGDRGSSDNLYLAVALIAVVVVTGCFGYYQEFKSTNIIASFRNLVPQAHLGVPGNTPGHTWAHLGVPGNTPGHTWAHTRRAHLSAPTSPTWRRATSPSSPPCAWKVSTPIAVEIEHFVDIIAGLAVFFGATFFLVAMLIGYPLLRAAVFFMAIVVAYVPEGLLATVTVCLSLTAKRLARRNCVVKNLEAVETLGSTSVICSDKTGTLTQNRMAVAHLWLDGQVLAADTTEDQSGEAFEQRSASWPLLSQVITLCNRAQFQPGQEGVPVAQRDVIGDASESALLKFAEVTSGPVAAARGRFPKVAELPFNSSNKFQVSVHEAGPQQLLVLKGAPERVLERCRGYLREGEEHPLDPEWRRSLEGACLELGGRGERVLGFCARWLPPGSVAAGTPPEALAEVATGLCFAGLVSLIDPPRATVPQAVRKCRTAGIRVIMVTGDHPVTAKAIAAAVGIISEGSETPEDVATRLHLPLEQVDPRQARARVVTGSELAALAPGALEELLRTHPEMVFARTSPQQKLLIVESCQRLGAIVAVTGDGVNDSPALKKADIGVAMGIAGSDAAKQAADMILLDDNFASIVTGVEQGRLIFDNLKKSIAYTLTKNIPELAPYLVYITASVPLPLGCITILFIELCTDIFPSVSLAYERAESDIMHLRPRDPRRDRLVNEPLAAYSYFQIGVIQSLAGFTDYFVAMAQEGWWPLLVLGLRPRWEDAHEQELQDSYGQQWTFAQRRYQQYTCYTVFFISIEVCQIADVLIRKTRRLSLLQQGLFRYTWAHLGTPGQLTCPGVPRRFQWWLVPMPFGLLILVYDEIRKLGVRRHPGSWWDRELYY
uniref:Sodium/potassium-transporting ATPase subunit alpha n=1 Tax=Taeniopygia guttata TaxID=59729 RepID=A0A674G8W7_TAEGU